MAYIAILAASIASFILGWLWYGPLFGKKWMELSGHKEGGKGSMAKPMVISFIATLVTVYVLSMFVGTGMNAALTAGFWLWLGFFAAPMVGIVLWDGKSWGLWFLNASYWLVNLEVMAAILAAMA